MATNDFLPFATSGTANVYTNADYVADPDQHNGNQPGLAKSKLVNKALRQSSIISNVVAQYIADVTGNNAVDDGTTTTLLADLKNAVSANNTIGSIAALRLTAYTGQQIIYVTGYYTAADNIGVREYYWDATNTTSDNGGTIIAVAGVTTGRWVMKYNGAVNVLWFGAKADYTGAYNTLGTGTDNATYFQKAAAISNHIFVPKGKYYSTAIGTFNNIIVEGEDQNNTFVFTSGTTTLFTITSSGTTSIFKDITFYGNVYNSITSLTRCIAGDTIRFKTYNASFFYFGNDAIYLTNAIDCSFENSYFSGGYAAQTVGTTTTRTSSGLVIDVGTWGTNNSIMIKKCYFQSWLYGVKLVSAALVSVEDTVMEYNFIGCYGYRPSGGSAGPLYFNNNWLEGNYYSLSGGALFNDFSDQTNVLKAVTQVTIGLLHQLDSTGRDKVTGLYAKNNLQIAYGQSYLDTFQTNQKLLVNNTNGAIASEITNSSNCDSYTYAPSINVTTLTHPTGLDARAKININTLDTSSALWTLQMQGQGGISYIRNLLNGAVSTSGSITIFRFQNENGATASRPTNPTAGMQFYDTTLSKPIWYSGSAWKDANGTTV